MTRIVETNFSNDDFRREEDFHRQRRWRFNVRLGVHLREKKEKMNVVSLFS